MAGLIMAGQTSNYNFDYPTSTDYVKDGATAIETLADDVDATLFTALGGDYPGLRLVKKQTIGTSVSSVTVTNAFSSTYEAYKIVVAGGSGSTNGGALRLRLGATTTQYYWVLNFVGYSTASGTDKGSNAINFGYTGNTNIDGLQMNCDLVNPFLSKQTFANNFYSDLNVTGTFSGYLNNNTSYTDFTLVSSNFLTGGTIYVYGYGAS
jgi:hypothetical protein